MNCPTSAHLDQGETRAPNAFKARWDATLRLMALILGVMVFSACGSSPGSPADQSLVARFYLEVRPGEAGVPLRLPVSGVTVTVGAKPVIVEYDFVNAEAVQGELGRCLWLQLTPAAARDLSRLSVTSPGRRLVLVLNDAPVGARRIEQALGNGTLMVFVETPDDDLAAIVARLQRTSANLIAAGRKTH